MREDFWENTKALINEEIFPQELKMQFGYMVKYQTLFFLRPLILLIFNSLQQHYFLVLHLFNK